MDLNKMLNEKLNGVANTQVVINGKYVRITMRAHWIAWCSYDLLFHNHQDAKRISDRGGFGKPELDAFYPEWMNHIVN